MVYEIFKVFHVLQEQKADTLKQKLEGSKLEEAGIEELRHELAASKIETSKLKDLINYVKSQAVTQRSQL